jgi:hypothetical protein
MLVALLSTYLYPNGQLFQTPVFYSASGFEVPCLTLSYGHHSDLKDLYFHPSTHPCDCDLNASLYRPALG